MLTVLIATHNGAGTLVRVLEGYCRLREPDGGWRLVVVDNGSTDGTRDILDAYRSRLPLTCLLEPRRGQNRARNTGLDAASGDLVVLSDDDTIPRPDWLAAMRRSADTHRAFSVFGGVILPAWEAPPAEWLLSWVPQGPCFARTGPTLEEGPVKPSAVFSPNMAVRADVLRAGYRFDESMGPNGTLHYAMGSETELLRRLGAAGYGAWHSREAVVEHIIHPFQMTPRWVLGRAVRFGRGQYRLLGWSRAQGAPHILGVPRFMLRQVVAQAARALRARLRGDAEATFRERWELCYLIGQVIEGRHLSRQGRLSRGETSPEGDCSARRHDRVELTPDRPDR
jgi:glycosyltransferase involved in cell wall biosynthesis